MSKTNVRRHALEKCRSVKETQKVLNHNFFTRNLKKVYPIGLQKSTSSLSLSSISLSLSQNSNDSSQADSLTPLDEKISLALRLISPRERREPTIATSKPLQQQQPPSPPPTTEPGELKRCNWITKSSDKAYIEFHDECWGVPAYDDNKLFELLALSGLLMDYNWTEILKRKETLREVFAGFDANTVAKMEEKEIMETASNKALSLADSRVMCVVDNAKCIMKASTHIVKECGSFSSYIWGYVNHKPIINRYRYPRNVPLRSPKAEALSKDLVKRGFRFVGPVIVHSFMQAAGLTIDHLVDCYRHSECVSLAERPWRHI
ncbi:Putative GMP synthase [glutamine-hydrolyzing] [Glycine soja]|uniref:Putative GMP synthase [glutamine-hydrolyzing] n=1 Tax=Glycine soja TaxID=3848 RepID=A0A0B2RZC7_GLYSO|nr:Putative GMP synthase [glutamine-hydrolyzing] [Glycine soja]